ATRAALGAGRRRLARELLLESTLLGCAGGALGIAIAAGAIRCFTAFVTTLLPRMEEISIDSTVLVFTAGISLVTGFVFGLFSVYRYVRPEPWKELRSGGRSLTGNRARRRARALLVSAQVALALVLLV